jgi:hypothetical protein
VTGFWMSSTRRNRRKSIQQQPLRSNNTRRRNFRIGAKVPRERADEVDSEELDAAGNRGGVF